MAESFEGAWRRRFERAAEKYTNDHAVSGWSAEGLRRRLVTFTREFERAGVPPARVVLDLGCGAGTYSAWLAARGHRVIGLDYSMRALRRAATRLGPGRVALVAGEAYHLPIGAGLVDVVVCIGVLQTLDRPRACLAEIRRVLVPGGRVFLMTLNAADVAARLGETLRRAWPARLRRRPQAGYKDLRRYHPDVLCRWMRAARLRVERVAPVYLLPERAARVSRFLERRGIYRALARLGPAPMPVAHAALYVVRAE